MKATVLNYHSACSYTLPILLKSTLHLYILDFIYTSTNLTEQDMPQCPLDFIIGYSIKDTHWSVIKCND